MSKKLAIIGAAELGTLVKYYAEETKEYEVVRFYDDFLPVGNQSNGLKVSGTVANILHDFQSNIFECLFIAIGYNYMNKRESYYNQFKNTIPFANIIHKSAYIDSSVKLGEGNIVFPGCIIDCFSELKENILLNTGVSIAHHTIINSNCFISPRVNIAGRVTVEQSCFIGLGATIKDLVKISKGCTIGAGSLVLKDTEPSTLVYGSPAKTIRKV